MEMTSVFLVERVLGKMVDLVMIPFGVSLTYLTVNTSFSGKVE